MKATFNRKSLLEAFAMVSGVVPTRSPKPILQNIKLIVETGADGVAATLVGTDLEVGVRRRVEGVKVDEDGDVILPTTRFMQILRTSADEDISIEADGDKLTVRGKRSKFALPNEDPTLFPDVPEFASESYLILIDSEVKKLIRRTAFATDLDSARYALGGTLCEMTETSLTLVGTDGRRLARSTAPAERVGGEYEGSNPVIPVKALKLIDKALDGDGDQVHIAFAAGQSIMVRSSDTVIYSRLVEGRFPRYTDVFPKQAACTIPLEVATFRVAIEQAAICASEESKGVTFRFSPDGVELTSDSADVGQSRIDLPLLGGFDGEGVSVVMDPDYVLDAMKALDSDAPLTVDLIDGKNAVLFKSGPTYDYIVMPITK